MQNQSAQALVLVPAAYAHQSNLDLHTETMSLAANYRRCEIELLDVISRVEDRRLYLEFEVTSLFTYCVEMLGLSRHAAYNFIVVARKSREVPALAEAIRSGRTTVSKARKICSVITVDNANEWIDLTIHCSARVVEKAVAEVNPREAVEESLRYISSGVLELKMVVSEEWSELLAETRDLLSQKQRRAVSSEEALFILMREFRQRNDPLEKAKRVATRIAPVRESISSPAVDQKRSRHVPATVSHAVALRDEGKCTFVDRHGKRCSSKRWLQLHHREHFSSGGEHSLENLETLCWAHHCMKHR